MITICISVCVCVIVVCFTTIVLNTATSKYKKAMSCLVNLVDELNIKFPGSSLNVIETYDDIKVKGELKYYKNLNDE